MTVNQSIKKIYWQDIREQINKVNPSFVHIVDELNVDTSFPLYLASYPYGAIIADTKNFFIPPLNDKQQSLSEINDKDIIKNLGYGKDTLPMGMVLEKNLEYFVEVSDVGISTPRMICEPGSFLHFSMILGHQGHISNGLLMTTAGVRSTFMLPNIGCITNHANLQRDFNVKKSAPKSLHDHWYVFREIANSKIVNNEWYCRVLFFSEKWLQKLHADKAWLPLKSYFLELAWKRFEYDRSHIFHDIAFSVMQKKRNLKPNPYLTDTARHLFSIALGCAPGFSPALDEESLPIFIIQKAIVESYNLKKYVATIMQPVIYNFEKDKLPTYYSLQHPTTHLFSPKSRRISNTLCELRELDHIMKIFSEELSSNHVLYTDTVLNKVAKQVNFNYFHNEKDLHHIIKDSIKIAELDARFNSFSENNSVFASGSKFVRGCISIG